MSVPSDASQAKVLLVDDEPANRLALRGGLEGLDLTSVEAQFGEEALAQRVGVSFAYVSKIESGRLDFGEYPSEGVIRKLAVELDADEDELPLLAQKIPEAIRRRPFERPDAFRQIARLDDQRLDRLLAVIESDVRSSARSTRSGVKA